MLASLLGSETRARVLTLLMAHPQRGFHVRELVREVGMGTSGVQREVARLEDLGVVSSVRDDAGRRVVRIVEEHPLVAPLAGLVAAETRAPYGGAVAVEERIGINPHTAPYVARIVELCREAGVERVVLFGSSTQPGVDIVPRDIDLCIRMGGPVRGSAERHFALRAALETLSGKDVDLVDERAVTNRRLREEIERTGVVIHEAA